MKKFARIILVLLCVAAIVCFAACENDASSDTPPANVSAGSQVSVSDDGYLVIDGVKTDFHASDGVDGKSAYEMYCEAHPEYDGNESKWLEDLVAGKLIDEREYVVISSGRYVNAALKSGEMTSAASVLSLKSAVLTLNTPIVLPIGEGAEWEIELKGEITSSASQMLTSLADGTDGRIYLGANGSDKIYLGVCIDASYANYYWTVDSETFTASHTYNVAYSDGEYLLSIDGGAARGIEGVNINQANHTPVITSPKASAELTDKMRAVTGQDYVVLTHIGAVSHKCTGNYVYINVRTSSVYGYREFSEHPLANKTIFYLGSSVTLGWAGDTQGTSFADLTANLTGNAFQKEAIGGTTLAVKGNTEKDSYAERLDNFDLSKKPDALVIQLSTNDFAQGISLGSVGSKMSSDSFDKTTMTGALEYIIAKVHETSPDTKVIVYACPLGTGWWKYSEYGGYISSTLSTLAYKWNGILEIFDLYNAEYVKIPSYIQSDDLHPTKAGYAQLFVPRFINLLTDIL